MIVVHLLTGLQPVLAALFVAPQRIPTTASSFLWALPICLSIALVYKALKLEEITPKHFVREVSLLFVTILGFLIAVALVLWVVALVATHHF